MTDGAVVTVGTFDGVHRGHRAVLETMVRRARERDERAVLVTFSPHPLRVVNPEAAPALLTTPDEKKELLAASGIDYVVFLPFTPDLARYTPRRFVTEILRDRFGMRTLVVGYDHGLGRGRSGDVETLRALGGELGFDVVVQPAVHLDGAPISSTRVRNMLASGDIGAAERALGRPYALEGVVVKGEGRGRTIGFPTANIQISDTEKMLPSEGVYAARAVVPDGSGSREPVRHRGVLHLGPRPTFRGSPPSIELHLFDFDRQIYGEEVRVEIEARLRGVQAFQSTAELVDAIRRDAARAREVLAEPKDGLPRP